MYTERLLDVIVITGMLANSWIRTPGHPAQRFRFDISATAGLLARGSAPLPPSRDYVAEWLFGRSSSLTVAGQAALFAERQWTRVCSAISLSLILYANAASCSGLPPLRVRSDQSTVIAAGNRYEYMFDSLLVCLAALAMDSAFGYPKRLFEKIGHPVCWAGALLTQLERAFNEPRITARGRLLRGFLVLSVYLMFVLFAAIVLVFLLRRLPLPIATALQGVLASSLIAQRSLFSHVDEVHRALTRQDLIGARQEVSRIVGRDTAFLDESGVIRAAIESLAENFSDGIVGPALFIAAFGLTGGVFYKAVNTADSMIGHRSPRYLEFGRAAARLDDVLNLLPARLSALLIVAAARFVTPCSWPGAWRIMHRDSRGHASPNAGWPQAAMAGALGIQLGGPRWYGGVLTAEARIGDGEAPLRPNILKAALNVYVASCSLLLALVGLALMASLAPWTTLL